MENKQPHASPAGKGTPPASDTKVVHETATPDEDDPLWDELGSTRITDGPADASSSSLHLDSSDNHTEFSPSRVLGKNLVMLGDFQLVKKLGEGAMGAVYKAVQVSRKRTVALKVLFPHVAKIRKLVDRLRREGLVMGQLDHPNIVQAYAVDEAEGCHYIAMEYVPGRSMQKWLNAVQRIPVEDAVRIVLDCAKALQYAHGVNVIHRDIKPDNILLTRAGAVKVTDLGMVKTSDEEMSLTQTGHAVGTPWYMPLEQARNAKEIDGRCDIYALGCTLYAFLTGNPPFVGATIVDVIRAKETGTFPPARQSNSHVPERLDLIIAKMTAKLPKYRYQTCDEVIKDLESLGLASEVLSFVPRRPRADQAQETPMPAKTAVPAVAAATETPIDKDQWFVQMKMQDNTVVTRKYKTAQLQKMLTEGTIAPTARASHDPNEGFRALATYKEFQGTAMSKMSKKAADKNTAKYRGIYKKIEEEDRKQFEKEQEANREISAAEANTRYWGGIAIKVVPICLGLVGAIVFLYWAANGFKMPW